MRGFQTQFITYAIALVWVAFAIFGKLVPITSTHTQIVERAIGSGLHHHITIAIGIGELFIALWIVSQRAPVLCGWLQIALVLTMNCIELAIARDLLLWGPLNALFALIFVGIVYSNIVRPAYGHMPPTRDSEHHG